MLFDDYKFLDFQFPEPQYLGAKFTHRAWINNFIPKGVNIVLDAFSGSQSIAFLFKQLGFCTLTNDFLNFNNQIGLSLIENKSEILTPDDIEFLFSKNTERGNYHLMQDTFTGIFFEQSETEFLDNFRANIDLLSNKYKKALAFTIINRSMTRKVTMGHFCHTQALNYASDPERIKRNRSLIRPLSEIFLDLVPKYNQAVFDNKQQNQSYNQNILDLLPDLKKVDLAYFDPPYCNSHADYQGFYHLLETYTEYWKDKQFINGIKRYEPQRISGFDKKRDAIHSFEKLFELSENIPHWLISYNDRSYPNIEEFEKILSKYKNVTIEHKEYTNSRGGKGSVAGSKEILFVCSPKKKFFIDNQLKTIKGMTDFNYWDNLHRDERLDEFSRNDIGLLWLKIKSIVRVKLVKGFLEFSGYTINSRKQGDNFRELFELLSQDVIKSHALLDRYIRKESCRQIQCIDIEQLVSELYKLKKFDWGGDYQNSLDKYLVSRYVKVQNPSYDNLVSKFETEINTAVQGYVLNSWYNYWSSILIENIFKSHPNVLPTIGQIKSVDFFINNIPFDLKVTYLPAEYIKSKRKEKGYPVELTFLKKKAAEAKIVFDKKAKPNDIFYEITEKMKDRNDEFCNEVLLKLKSEKTEILKDAQANPKMLAKWLYENQGEMRFGSENRLYLVLVDTNDFNNSWKLKRNIDVLKPAITSYLDNFTNEAIDDLNITFEFKGKSHPFSVLTDIIFVIK